MVHLRHTKCMFAVLDNKTLNQAAYFKKKDKKVSYILNDVQYKHNYFDHSY